MRALVEAKPESLEFETTQAALIINDMQNAFCSRGGYIDKIGFDLGGVALVVENIQRVLAIARGLPLTIIHLQNGFSANQVEAPGPDAPLWRKSNALRYMRANPDEQGKILTRGTWDYELIEALRPGPGEILIEKHSDSGFAGTALDHHLRSRRINTFLMCGLSSNVGVESTIRAGYHAGYFALMITDACMAVGPPFMQAATEFNVERFFGWVASTDEVVKGLGEAKA